MALPYRNPRLTSLTDPPIIHTTPIKCPDPKATLLISPHASAASVVALRGKPPDPRAIIQWHKPPIIESAHKAVRLLLPLQWSATRKMDAWQNAYFSFYDLGMALGAVSRVREIPCSAPPGGVQVLYGAVAAAVGAFVGGACVFPKPPPPHIRGDDDDGELAVRWRLVTDVTQRVCRHEGDRHDFWRLVGAHAYKCAILLRALQARGDLPDEILMHIAQTLVLSSFPAPEPPPPPPSSRLNRCLLASASPC